MLMLHCTTQYDYLVDLMMVDRAKSGDSQGFTKLLDCYRPMIRHLWQQYYIPELELKDWRQEAELVLVRVLRSYHGRSLSQLGGFYKQSLINRLLDLRRSRQAGKRIPPEQLASLGMVKAELLTDLNCTDPDEEAYCQACLRNFAKNCSPFELQVVMLKHQGQNRREIAQQLGYTERQIQAALSRCRRKLMKELCTK
ncbi:sigma-70 family RNA polymerase sigma factor [Limosilactobacillus kribbianus]|uniref:sigma-70 family RNA polymerase sigma factor n=1 Tax=Limosilactobacillus kribbianus TaxID=2982695 RepID=UPI00226431CB|nr:sigma-70 family RNA polymerase sigma factor [Limosilactobacillus kribbianus]